MLIDRTHKPWFVGCTLLVASAGLAYAVGASDLVHGVTGGGLLGLTFGIVGSVFMVIAALLAVRKRLPTWRIGSAQFWLRAHLWLGSVGFILILFHSGFGWGGLLENLLWVSFGLVVVTGFAGLAFQQVIPRLLTTRIPLETMVTQIPFLSRTMLFRADQLVAKQAGPLDVEFESLKPFAEAVLQQQRVLKRESDFPKELAKVYANVPLPDADAKKSPAAEGPAIAAKPLPPGSGSQMPSDASETKSAAPTTTTTDAAPAAKSNSPLELMRDKAAAKAASESVLPSASEPLAAKPKSPLELLREKATATPAASAETTAPADAPVPATPLTAGDGEKKLSPVEMMRAKMSAAKGSPADKPTDAPQPLTIEKPTATSDGVPAADKPAAATAVKKPGPMLKPTAGAEVPPKPKTVVIPPALLAVLRDFHVKIVRPFLDTGRSPQHELDDALTARRLFAQLKSDLPSELHESVEQIESFCEERRQFVLQKRLHRWMHWWLILHIPPSIALLVLFVAHVVVSLRVVPWEK